MLGGSSSINGLVYVRGHPHGFRPLGGGGRARLGAIATCCPISGAPRAGATGADAYRGADGPLATRRGTRRNPLYDAFIEAGRQAGYPVSSDLNGEWQEGFGRFDMTVKDGVRWSAANAYLRAAMKRAEPSTSSLTRWRRSILFEGRRAVGVRYEQGGRDHDRWRAGAR